MDLNNITVKEYITQVRTLLSKQEFSYCTGIPQFMWLPAGIHEVLGSTKSGRTVFVLSIASSLLSKGIVPLLVDTTGKLTIEQVETSGISPEFLPVINLSQVGSIKNIAMEKVVTAVIIDELTPIHDKKTLMNDISRIKSIRPEMLFIIVNQFRNDIVKKHKVPAHEAITYPYLNSRFVLRREEKKLGGTVTIVSWYNMVGKQKRTRFSILQKKGTIPYEENILMSAISTGKARMIKRKVYIGNESYNMPFCLKDKDFINRLTELVFEPEEQKDITQNVLRVKTGRHTSSFGVNILMSTGESQIHPTRMTDFRNELQEDSDDDQKD